MNERQLKDCFSLMQTLMQYRRQPIYRQLEKIREKQSMLHADVLQLIYHFARICCGSILEIGAFLGGATVAAAFGIRDVDAHKSLITIQPPGHLRHHRLATRNILRDLKRNLAKQQVAHMVTLLEGRSFEPHIIAAVHEALGRDQVGLMIFDADAGVKRDIDRYAEKLADDCWMVIDDYCGSTENRKTAPTHTQVDELIAAGKLVPLGYYGWSTWIGRWRRSG